MDTSQEKKTTKNLPEHWRTVLVRRFHRVPFSAARVGLLRHIGGLRLSQSFCREGCFFFFFPRPRSCLDCPSRCCLGCGRCRRTRRTWRTEGTASSSPSSCAAAAAGPRRWQWGRRAGPGHPGPPASVRCWNLPALVPNSPAGGAPGEGRGWGTRPGAGWPPGGRPAPGRCAGCWCRGCSPGQCPGPEPGRGAEARRRGDDAGTMVTNVPVAA